VVHSISLPPGQYGGDAVQRLFSNQLDWDAHPYFQSIRGLQVSSHFFIRRDGSLWQFVSCDDRAWHAGASHYRGKSHCNDDSVGVELEGLEGETFEDAQYQCLAHPMDHPSWKRGKRSCRMGEVLDKADGFEWIRGAPPTFGSD
jgi:AmpD protein